MSKIKLYMHALMSGVFRKRPKGEPIEAAAAVFVRRGETGDRVMMIEGRGALSHFPGYHMFPWGRLDKKKHGAGEKETQTRETLSQSFPGHDPLLLHVLQTSLNEKLGFSLVDAAREGHVKEVRKLGSAVTLDFYPHRFNIHYFLVELAEEPASKHNKEEVAQVHWAPPSRFTEQYKAGELLALPSVLNLLDILSKDGTNETGVPFAYTYDPRREVPYVQPVPGVHQLFPLAFTFPPINRTNCFVIGDEESNRWVVDPSPRSRGEYRRLVNTLKSIGFSGIFITHHHMDHIQNAPRLAREFSLPMVMSGATRRWIIEHKGERFFRGVEVRTLKEGEILAHWRGEAVTVYEVPGHSEGHLALMPESKTWFLAGDLTQSMGTVVIGLKDGDMGEYFRTLERIIQWNPRVILPSHGLVMGTVESLEKTLAHRRLREKQVLHLKTKGLTVEEMVEEIYRGVPKALWPWAIENIRAHLKKLAQEGEV